METSEAIALILGGLLFCGHFVWLAMMLIIRYGQRAEDYKAMAEQKSDDQELAMAYTEAHNRTWRKVYFWSRGFEVGVLSIIVLLVLLVKCIVDN